VLLDTDLGVGNDDFLALCLALSSRAIHLEAVSACAGNYSMKQALWNALSILEHVGRGDVPVLAGSPLPLVHPYRATPGAAFGYWGEVDRAVWPFTSPASTTPHRLPAAAWLSQRLAVPPAVTLVAIGPLTNVALALGHGPLPALERIVVMGGRSEGHGPPEGNATPHAEFNFWVDPEAASKVFAAGYAITLLPLHVWSRVELGLDHLLQIADGSGPVALLLATMLFAHQLRGTRAVVAGDALAVATLLWPDLFTTEAWNADVVTQPGEDYGRLVLRKPSRGNGRVELVVDVAAGALIQRLVAELATGGSEHDGVARRWPDRRNARAP
jgi:inosine-uridine nucleoside N-ribohydrolase